MSLAPTLISQYFRNFFGKSPLCDGCRSCVALRGGSQLFQYLPDLLAARVVKLQREGLAIVRDGAFILPDESERIGAARKTRGDTGGEPDRFVEVLYCAIVPLPSRVDETAIAEGRGVVGIKPDDLVEILDGSILVHPLDQISVEIPLRLLLIGEGPGEKGPGEIGIEPNRPVAVLNGKIDPPLDPARVGPINDGRRVCGIKPDRL